MFTNASVDPSSSSSSFDFQNIRGDVIGIGVSGNGNIIGKDINVVIKETQSYGLALLSANHFKEYKSTENDLIHWQNGFSFKLEAIKEKMELRRNNILDRIKTKLENQHRLLIVGESGTSKSTILMEIMCEYFDCGYKILYNFGETEIKNSMEAIEFIKGLLKANNRVLIAVDNVHSERTAAIFYIIDQLSNYQLTNNNKNLLFILTARIPEFDWFVNDRLNMVDESYRQPIQKFVQVSQYRYEVESFTTKDIEAFINLYKDKSEEVISSREKISDLAAKIFDNTKGLPIMVKFYVLGKGLREDVEERYYRYLTDSITMQPDSAKIQTMLICSLLDNANLPITDKLLEKMEIQSYAYELERAMLYHYSGLWKTIHPRWSMELLSFLYNEKNNSILIKRKTYLKKALDSIFYIADESITASTIQATYDIVSLKKIPVNIVESSTNMPDYLSDKIKSNLLFAAAYTYRILGIYPKMLEYCDKALLSQPNDVTALNGKAISLWILKRYDECIECCDKILKIHPNDAAALTNKGIALDELKKYDEAQECWKRAVEIDDYYVRFWTKDIIHHSLKDTESYDNSLLIRTVCLKLAFKGTSYAFIKKYSEALECSNKALELDPNSFDNLNNKAWALDGLKRYDEALECSNKALELDPNSALAFTNKAWALDGLKRYDEALECSNKALELDATISIKLSAYTNKAVSLNGLKRYDEALECSNKALEINAHNDWTWLVKGLVLNSLKRYDEALECSNKALELDAKNDFTWNNKAWALANLGKYDEALECSNKALELDANSAWAFTNKAWALNQMKRYDEALECGKKALELDANSIPPNWYTS